MLLDYDHTLPRLGIFGGEVDFFVEFDLGRYLGLILVARIDSEVFLLSA